MFSDSLCLIGLAAVDDSVIHFAVLDIAQFDAGNFGDGLLSVCQVFNFRIEEIVAQSERLVFFLLTDELLLQFFRMPDAAFAKPKAVLTAQKCEG